MRLSNFNTSLLIHTVLTEFEKSIRNLSKMLVSAKSLHMYASSAHITRIASPGPAHKELDTSIECTHQRNNNPISSHSFTTDKNQYHITLFTRNESNKIIQINFHRPGNGCLWTSSGGSPRSLPMVRTSSLWKSLSGSTTLPCLRSSLTSSVSLWWVFMASALPLASSEALSIKSGLNVP